MSKMGQKEKTAAALRIARAAKVRAWEWADSELYRQLSFELGKAANLDDQVTEQQSEDGVMTIVTEIGTNTATFVRKDVDDKEVGPLKFRRWRELYRLEHPVEFVNHGEELELGTTFYVIVSAIHDDLNDLCETLIFPASKDGKIISWTGLPGSHQDNLCHELALVRAGWNVVDKKGRRIAAKWYG